MTTTLKNPQLLIDEAKKYGVDLGSTVSFDEAGPLNEMQAQFNGTSADFGLFAKLWGKKFDRKFRKGIKKVGKVAKIAVPVAAFVIPGIGPAIGVSLGAAMAAGDKVLGGMKPAERKKIISNTKALAAVGDPDAKRGMMVLNTVHKIRVEKKIPDGKRAIPKPAQPVKAAQVFKMVSQPQVYKLAAVKHAKVVNKASKQPVKPGSPLAKKLTFWTRVKLLFGVHVDGVAVIAASPKSPAIKAA